MKYALIFLLMVSSVSAVSSYFGDYVNIQDTTYMQACEQVIYDTDSSDIRVKLTVNLDEKEILSTRWCRDGLFFSRSYYRQLWIKEDDLSSDLYDLTINNNPKFTRVFESDNKLRRSLGVLYTEDYVNYVPAIVNNPVNTANGYLKHDTVRGVDYSKDDASFYYSIGVGDAEGITNFYNTATGSFASQDTFTDAGLPYPLDDLSNPSVIAESGRTCNGVYKCVRETELDVDLNNAGSEAFFAYSDDINYYYYPFYVVKATVTVRGYTNSSKTTQNYYKVGKIEPTSTEIYFPEVSPGDIGSSFETQKFRVYDDAFNYPSKINFDGIAATIPSGSGYVEVETTVYFNRNPFYRHRSPADATWSFYNLTNGDCTSVSGSLCNDAKSAGFKLVHTTSINTSSGTTDIPSTSPDDLDNSTPQNNFNNTVPTNSTFDDGTGIGDGGLSGNGTGVDWTRDPNDGGGLQGQIQYAEGRMGIASKAGFFEGLQVIALTILEIVLTLFMLLILGFSIFIFLIMVPSAYRKLLNELKKLGDMRWR